MKGSSVDTVGDHGAQRVGSIVVTVVAWRFIVGQNRQIEVQVKLDGLAECPYCPCPVVWRKMVAWPILISIRGALLNISLGKVHSTRSTGHTGEGDADSAVVPEWARKTAKIRKAVMFASMLL